MVQKQFDYLLELITHVLSNTIADRWHQAKSRIMEDANHLDEMLQQEDAPKIYGVNTLVGHMDNVGLNKDELDLFQTYLIKNHSIGIGERYSAFESKCVGYTKIHFYSLGGSGITPELYEYLISIINLADYQPFIPKHASYSSGDVIPAAHWASEMAHLINGKYNYTLKRKEGISLINGSFVHVGIAIAKLLNIQPVWALYNYNSIQYAKLLNTRPSNFSKLITTNEDDSIHYPLNWIKTNIPPEGKYNVQDSVSIRAYPQIASAMFNSIEQYIVSIEEQLSRRSDNPIILAEETYPLSQGSFLAPMISLSTSQLIESILLTMWSIERRIHFLLSGNINDIPLNGSSQEDPLGFIQVPKMITAILEESRLISGRRTFAAGSSTSYGIEDIWTNGLASLEILDKLISNMNKLLSIELTLIVQLTNKFLHKPNNYQAFPDFLTNKNLSEVFQQVVDYNSNYQLPIEYMLAPFKTILKGVDRNDLGKSNK